MRDVRHEFLPPLFGFFERVGHGVEGVGQIDDLLTAALRHLDAGIELAAAKAAGGLRDLVERLHLLV